MLKNLSRLVSLAACVALFSAPFAFAYVNPGNPTGFVNDFAGILSTEEQSSLEQTLQNNKNETGNEIVVVTVENLGGDTVENFAEKLFQEWGIGEEGRDNGALLLVALEDRAMRIEVGYGLEGALTDSIAGKIIRNDITPQFREGNYYEGIAKAVDQMVAVTKGEEYAEPQKTTELFNAIASWGMPVWVGIIFFVQWLMSIFARSKSWWLGGVIGACIGVGIGIFTTLLIGLVSGVLLTLFGLLLDFIVSREYTNSKAQGRTPHWWAGGSGFRGGGGGGGFGGFGGGRSGGGGASGRW